MNIGTLSVSIVAETTKFATGITKSQTIVKQFTSSLNLLRGGLVALGAAAGLRTFKTMANDIELVADKANQLGLNFNRLNALKFAGEMSNVEFGTFARGLTLLQKALGTGTAGDTLRNLGLNLQTIKGMSIDDAFIAIAEAISRLENESDRTTAAMELFGRSGAELLPFLSEGASGIAKLTEEYASFNRELSSTDVEAVRKANDALDKLGKQWESLKTQGVVTFGPVVSGAMGFVNEAISGARQFFDPSLRPGNQPSQLLGIAQEMRKQREARELDEWEKKMRETMKGLGAEVRGIKNMRSMGAVSPQNAIAKFLIEQQVKQFLQRGASGLGNFLGNGGIPGALGRGLGNATAMAARGMGGFGPTPGFALTQAGTAESYRQQARISRQNDAMKEQTKLAKEDAKRQDKHTGLLEKIANGVGGFMAANL